MRSVARAAVIGSIAGVLALGVGGRTAMRGVALLAHQPTHFGLPASLGIVFIGGVLGVLAGAAWMLIDRRHPLSSARAALSFGSVMFLVLVPLQPPAIRTEFTALAERRWLALAPFWVICVGYALLLRSIQRRLFVDAGSKRVPALGHPSVARDS